MASASASFRDFADKYGVRTSVELDAERAPVLDADDGEAIASTFSPVELVVGEEEEEEEVQGANGAAAAPPAAAAAALAHGAGRRLGAGAVFVTTRRVVWVPGASAAAAGSPCVSLAYRQIVMHAVATDAAAFARPCLYLQLDDGDEGAAGGGGEDGGDEGAAVAPAPELRLVPEDAAQGEVAVGWTLRTGAAGGGTWGVRCFAAAAPRRPRRPVSLSLSRARARQRTPRPPASAQNQPTKQNKQSSPCSRRCATTPRSTRTRTRRSRWTTR
jgi:hypothetical protein